MKVPNLEPIDEEVVHDGVVEVVWDPEEGSLHMYDGPKPAEYELRDVGGVSTPFLTEAVIAERAAQSTGQSYLNLWEYIRGGHNTVRINLRDWEEWS